jgi:simple sugar transport system substrate-binding protein
MTRAAWGALCALLTTVVTALPARVRAADPKPPEKKLKACFIYVGPVGDLGWSHAHDEARRLAEKALPGLQTQFVEAVPEAQGMPVIDRLVKSGCQVIFTTSFGYMDHTVEAAKKYPDVVFAHATGFKRGPNLATYMADFYQVYYLNGLMAGALTRSGKVGYVAAFPIPELKRHISAFALGVTAVRPGAVVNVKWINSWFSPQKAREAAEALMVEGNDVLNFTEDTATVVQVAARKKLPSFSHYSPMYRFAPDHVVSGQLVHWEKIYIDFLGKVRDGTYAAGKLKDVDYWWLLREGAVELGAQPGMPINPKYVDALKRAQMTVGGKQVSVHDRIMELLQDMASPDPKFDPFTGPLKDRHGVERVPAGRRMTVEELNSMQWVVPGVVGPVADEPK